MDNHSSVFKYLLVDKILIGKDKNRCQMVIDGNNPYISNIHCEIVNTEQGVYVVDGSGESIKSLNGTFVNNKKAAPELPLPTGAVLRLGDMRFKVKYKYCKTDFEQYGKGYIGNRRGEKR